MQAPDVKAVNKRLQLPLHIAYQYRLAPKVVSPARPVFQSICIPHPFSLRVAVPVQAGGQWGLGRSPGLHGSGVHSGGIALQTRRRGDLCHLLLTIIFFRAQTYGGPSCPGGPAHAVGAALALVDGGDWPRSVTSRASCAQVYHEICKKHATPSTSRGRLALPPGMSAPPGTFGLTLPPAENYHRVEALVNERDGILRDSRFDDGIGPGVDAVAKWTCVSGCCSVGVEGGPRSRVHVGHPEGARLSLRGARAEHLQVGVRGVGAYVNNANTVRSLEGTSRLFMLDEDTTLNKDSFAAAATAAGAVVAVRALPAHTLWPLHNATQATRRVCGPKAEGERACRNAICVVRPPGHHAGPRGQVTPLKHVYANVCVYACFCMHLCMHACRCYVTRVPVPIRFTRR